MRLPSALRDVPYHIDPSQNPLMEASLGINMPTYYLTGSRSFSEVHPEDGYLESCNVVHWGEEGAVKIWLFVHQDYSGTLDANLRGIIRKMREARDDVSAWLNGCGYPLHHKNLMVTPAFLRSASISFQVDCHPPGTLVYVRNGVYHQVINTGVL